MEKNIKSVARPLAGVYSWVQETIGGVIVVDVITQATDCEMD